MDGYRLHLRFTSVEEGVYDCSPLLDLCVFRQMRDPVYFGQVALCPGGTLAWPDEQDICHDTLYLEASKTS